MADGETGKAFYTLAEGITLYKRTDTPEPVWMLRATQQARGKQRLRRWSLKRHDLYDVLAEACIFRARNNPNLNANTLFIQAMTTLVLNPEIMEAIRREI